MRYPVNSSDCIDIDECTEKTHECGVGHTCQNNPGSYTCVCSVGYEVGPDKQCVDVDECSIYRVKNNGTICGQNGRCENTVGSYRCVCDAGFSNVEIGHGFGVCEDVDECQESPELCEHDCTNTRGSYRCSCKSGFRFNSDNESCTDIDECEESEENNLCDDICVNTPGSYACTCSTGYQLNNDNKTCQGTNLKAKKVVKKQKITD